MTSNWETVRLGDVTTQVRKPFKVEPSESYVSLGLRMYGRGVFARESKLGAEIKGSTLYQVAAGQFIYNRMFAAGGSFGVVSDELAHGVVSNEFPTFDVLEDKLLIGYLELVFSSPQTWAQVEVECTGTTKSRLRWKESSFANFKVSLPPLTDQRRIVDLIGSLDDAIEAAEESVSVTLKLLRARRDFLMSKAGTPLDASKAFEITMGRQRSPKHESGDGMTSYLRSANISPGQLNLDDVKTMNFSESEVLKYQLKIGDVLVTEGSGSLATVGAPARWTGEIPGPVCFQNTLLRYRSLSNVTTDDFVYHWCQWAFESGLFLDIASGTNIKHIGSTRAELMAVSLPALEDMPAICSELEALESTHVSASAHAASLRKLHSELLTSLLSGAHTIPESYDDVMTMGAEAPAMSMSA